jgi:hypothetical protein
MKNKLNKLFLTLILSSLCLIVKAQNPLLTPPVDINDISIKSSAGSIVSLGSTLTHFTTVFGTPDSIITEYAEVLTDSIKTCHYGPSEFDFVQGKLAYYTIKGNTFHLGNTNSALDILIGAHVSTISRFFPNTASLTGPGALIGTLAQNGDRLDDFIIFFYDSGKLITSISVRTP